VRPTKRRGARAADGAVRAAAKLRERYGPWAVVAGASVGLGAAYVRALAAAGVNVVAIARRGDALAALKVACESEFHVSIETVVADLSVPASYDAIVHAAAAREIGLLVYNAAFANTGAFLDRSPESQRIVLQVDCQRPVELARHFAAAMAARGRGGILLMSSLTSFSGSPYIAVYGAAKSFITVFAESLWYELKRFGVDVTACCAGVITTPNYLAEAPGKATVIPPPTMTPEQVAAQALAALGRGPVFIPGRMNRFLSFIMRRLMSRRAATSLMGRTVSDLQIGRPSGTPGG
jgi:uncharacterized protein